MFDRLIESGGHHMWRGMPAFSIPAVWSAGAHLAIVAAVLLRAGGETEGATGYAYREALFLLPLLPAPGATKAEPVEGVVFRHGVAQGVVAPEKAGAILPIVGERATVPAAERAGALTESPDTTSLSLSAAYLESELDSPAERDPMSAAPAYPETLRASGVEGHVVAQYVIDTTGYADVRSFRVMDTSHPLFTNAVREALPGMHFRPAELSGKRVRQIVQQEFKFVITREASADTTADTTAPAGATTPADSLPPSP